MSSGHWKSADQLCGPSLDLRGIARVVEYQRELVAAQPRDDSGLAGDAAQALADLHKDAIAEVMAQRVVDGLEVVEIEEQYGDMRSGRTICARGVEHFIQALEQLPSVRQVRERVVLGEVPQLQRALLDAMLELRLVSLDDALGIGQLRSQVIECLGEFIDLAGAAANDAGREIAGCEKASAHRKPAHRPGDGPCRGEQCEQCQQDRLVGRGPERLLRARDGLLRAFGGGRERVPCGCFDVLAKLRGERITVDREQRLPRLDFRTESQGPTPQRNRLAEILHLHRQPVAAG